MSFNHALIFKKTKNHKVPREEASTPTLFFPNSPIGTRGDSLVFLRNFPDRLSSPSGGTHQPLLADMIPGPDGSGYVPRLLPSPRRRKSTMRMLILVSRGRRITFKDLTMPSTTCT